MFQKIFALAAWCCHAFIAFATLSPIGLRPRAASVGYEHVAAFAVAGLLCGLAYPLGKILVIAIVFGTAVLWKYFSWSLLIATPTGRSYWAGRSASPSLAFGGLAALWPKQTASQSRATRSEARCLSNL